MNRNQDTENQKNQNRSGSCSFWQISSGLSIQIGSDVVFSHVFSGLGCLLGLEILSDTGEKAQWKQKRRFPADVSNEFHQGLFTSSHTLPMKGRRMRKKLIYQNISLHHPHFGTSTASTGLCCLAEVHVMQPFMTSPGMEEFQHGLGRRGLCTSSSLMFSTPYQEYVWMVKHVKSIGKLNAFL